MLPIEYERIVREARYRELLQEGDRDRLARLVSTDRSSTVLAFLRVLVCRLPVPLFEQACALQT